VKILFDRRRAGSISQQGGEENNLNYRENNPRGGGTTKKGSSDRLRIYYRNGEAQPEVSPEEDRLTDGRVHITVGEPT